MRAPPPRKAEPLHLRVTVELGSSSRIALRGMDTMTGVRALRSLADLRVLREGRAFSTVRDVREDMAGASGSSEAFGSSKRGEQRLSGVVGTTNDDRAVTKRRQRLVRFERMKTLGSKGPSRP